MDKFEKLLNEMDSKGEQLWFVRIVAKDGGKIERWIVAPIRGRENIETKLTTSLEAVIEENDNSEYYDCVNMGTKGQTDWKCTLLREGKITGPGGHVFHLEENK